MGTVTLGIDIGQRRDPTAIAVVEAERRAGETLPPPLPVGLFDAETWQFLAARGSVVSDVHHTVRWLSRLPLGTPYPAVVRRIGEIVSGVTARTGHAPAVFYDATGVGTPIGDMLREAGIENLLPVWFTHGDKRQVKKLEAGPGVIWRTEIRLGKAWLVSRLQALLQTDRLHLPETAEARALAGELRTYEIRVDADANDTYGAFKVGTHDDLVTALGLGTQIDPPGPMEVW